MLKRFKFLVENIDAKNPERVKEFIAWQNYTDNYKDNLIDAYSHYCKFCNIQ